MGVGVDKAGNNCAAGKFCGRWTVSGNQIASGSSLDYQSFKNSQPATRNGGQAGIVEP